MAAIDRQRLAVLTHMISPHTAPIYRALNKVFDVSVLISGHQDNRRWDVERLGGSLPVRKAFGITVKWRQRASRKTIWEERYTHFNPGYLLELIRYRPSAVFSHEMGFRTIAALIYGKLFRVPIWVFWEGPNHTEAQISGVKRVLRKHLFARLVPRWVTCGQSSTDYLTSLGIPPGRIVTAQNPVDEEPYRTHTDPYPLAVPRPVALCVSRLTGLKGIDRLLRVTADLQQEGFDFSLVVVGDGPEGEPLDELARQLGVRQLQWVPYVPLEEMPAVYRSADFLVFPTLSDVWGLVVNEALWSNLPVIASRYSGAALDLLPESNVFDPRDPDDFRAAFRRALSGQIAAPECSPLMTAQEVANLISDDIRQEIGERG